MRPPSVNPIRKTQGRTRVAHEFAELQGTTNVITHTHAESTKNEEKYDEK